MKIRLLTLLFCGVLVQEARALKAADPTELAAIQQEIDQVKDIQTRTDGIDDVKLRIAKEKAKGVDGSWTKIQLDMDTLGDLKFRQGVIAHRILKDVEKAYDIHPPNYSGRLAVDAFQGETTHWDPKVKDLGPDGSELRAVHDDHGRPKLDDHGRPMLELYLEAPNIHYDGNHNKDCKPIPMRYPVPPDATPGSVTWPNGLIEVDLKLFLESPGYIAASIFHETIHFKQWTDPNSETRPKTDYKAEQDAFEDEEIAEVAYFGLTAQEYTRIDKTKINELKWTKTHPSRFILVPTLPGSVASTPPDLGTPEAIKAGGDADFLKGAAQLNEITLGDLYEFNSFESQAISISQYQLQREQQRIADEARQAQEGELRRAQLAATAARQQAADTCGFEEVYRKWGDAGREGFREKGVGMTFYFRGTTPPDDDATKAAYLLARACLQQTQGFSATANGAVEEPCDDALDVLERRWTDNNFRNSLFLGTEESWQGTSNGSRRPPISCVNYVIRSLRAPVDMQRIRKVMQDFRKEVLAAEKEMARRFPSPSPKDPGGGNRPAPRNDPKPEPSPHGPHCWPGNEGGMSCVKPND